MKRVYLVPSMSILEIEVEAAVLQTSGNPSPQPNNQTITNNALQDVVDAGTAW